MEQHAAVRPKFPNFDYLRLFAALAVLLHHSITVANGNDRYDPVAWLTGQDFPTGTYAVCIFFIISGFLVTMSASLNRSVLAFIAGRVLRIYPGLFACQLLTALILGTIFTSLPPVDFLAAGHAIKYAIHFTLDPGMTWDVYTVRFYDGAGDVGVSFNASLWSIQQELACYTIIAILLCLRWVNWISILVMLTLTMPFLLPWSRDNVDIPMELLQWSFREQRLQEFLWVASSFFTGSLLYFFWRRRSSFPAWPLAICLALFLFALAAGRLYDFFPFYAAYPLLCFATASRMTLPSLHKIGDLSYGIYLYSWPYQQTVRAVIGPDVTWWQIFLLAGGAATVTAYMSWHLLEKPALALKRWFRREGSAPAASLNQQALQE